MAEDDIVRWHHQLNGHEPEQTRGDSEGCRSCCAASDVPIGMQSMVSQRVRHDLATEHLIERESNVF